MLILVRGRARQVLGTAQANAIHGVGRRPQAPTGESFVCLPFIIQVYTRSEILVNIVRFLLQVLELVKLFLLRKNNSLA